MRKCSPIPMDSMPVPFRWDVPGLSDRLKEAQRGIHRKIVVLDDDPTGVQTVHDVRFTPTGKRKRWQKLLPEKSRSFLS